MNTQTGADTLPRNEGNCACRDPGEPAPVSGRCGANCGRTVRLYLAPLAVAALFLAAFLFSAIHPPAPDAGCMPR